MGTDREYESTPASPEPVTPVSQTEVSAPAAPVPMAVAAPIGGLVVGHAEDRAEADADRLADSALGRLQRLSTDAHVHGPGCDHLRRMAEPPAPSAAPVVGREGGALDAGTSGAIERARGGGRPLPSDLRRRMETAFSSNFGAVRIHDDGGAAKLNEAVSARAFTTGTDIFFGRGQFAPSTQGGERVLAHELAHVVQDSGKSVSRSLNPRASAALERSVQIRRDWFTLPWRKTEAQKAEAAAEKAKKQQEEAAAKAKKDEEAAIAKSRKDGGATLGEFAKKNKKVFDQEKTDKADALHDKRKDGAKTLGEFAEKNKEAFAKQKASDAYVGGVAGTSPTATKEAAKPIGVGATLGAIELGTQLGHAAASGVGVGLNGLLVLDPVLGINSGLDMRKDANEFGDEGMSNLAGRKLKNQGGALATGAIGAAGAGVTTAGAVAGNVSSLHQAGWTAAGTAGNAAFAAGGAAVGVAAGSAQVLQGAWRGGKAVMKLCRLAWGRASTMLSARGAEWKKAIVSAERYKAAVAALKISIGVLGIAAGALFIVSNPIGWGIGIAAAIVGGAYAAAKIAGKISNARDKSKAAERIAKGESASDLFKDMVEPGNDAEETAPAKGKGGFSKPKIGPKSQREISRTKAIEQANEVAREASSHARLAEELRVALGAGDPIKVTGAIDRSNSDKAFSKDAFLQDGMDRELHDSYLLLSSINVDTDEALSESGQELIEKKLSKVEVM